MSDMRAIADDLTKLLIDVRPAKPVVVTESKKQNVELEALASELASVVFKSAPVGTKPEIVAEALLHGATLRAEEHNLNAQELFESAIDYCIKVIESAQSKIITD